MVGYKWVLKYIITNNLAAPALAPHGTINNDVIYAGTLMYDWRFQMLKIAYHKATVMYKYKNDRNREMMYSWFPSVSKSMIRSDN